MWIDIKEQLPPLYEDVLVYLKEEVREPGRTRYHVDKLFRLSESDCGSGLGVEFENYYFKNISHWMLIPPVKG